MQGVYMLFFNLFFIFYFILFFLGTLFLRKVYLKNLLIIVLQVDYILEQKKGSVQACVEHFLQLWVENEGEEGNKHCILYILGGAKLAEASEGVFQ